MNKLLLYGLIILCCISFTNAYTNTTYNPNSFTNPSYAFDNDTGTFAEKIATGTYGFGVIFNDYIPIKKIYSYTQIASGGSGTRTIEIRGLDNLTWTTIQTLPTGTEIIDNLTTQNLYATGIKINFTGVTTRGRVMELAWYDGGNSIETNLNYNNPVLSGEINTIYFNVTNSTFLTIDTLQSANATLYYNNHIYNMTQLFQNSSSAGFYYNVNAPSVNHITDIGFNITYFVNGNIYNTGNNSQTINIMYINVTTLKCNPIIFNFTLYDEENFTGLNGTWNYNFKYGLSNNTLFTTNGSLIANNFSVCFDNSSSHNINIGYGEIDYSVSGWVSRRYYIFNNYSANDTTTTVIPIYDLNTNSATAFSLQVQGAGGEFYKNKYIALIRYYNNLNSYKIVDMGLTDDTGSSVIYVKTQDVDYRIAVYELNGSLIYMANPIRMICLTTPCSYTLRVIPGGVDYTSLLKIQYTFTFNETTGIWSLIYSDPSLFSTGMNLSIFQQTNYGDTLICNSITYGSVGAVSCNTSGYVGNMIGKVTRLPGNYNLAQLLSDITSTPFKSEFGLWLTLIIAIPVILLFAMVSPIALLVGAVISLIPALYFGSLNWLIVGGIAILAFIVSHFIKRVS
jgi:hypothetical protein